MNGPTVTLNADSIRMLADLAGMILCDDDLPAMSQRLSAILAELGAVPDAILADLEPAVVRPLTPVSS